ncbi:MraY family glycosyltransferase [Burkholderia multivorans]|uniref:MraY family glycosyltransferase n=1 Tax=Burkholderia multivorans TaxID=87883 RepID=UPI00018E34F8|nr:glycosyltransferase family 4 protein [Burkholderia multivorans]EED99051.1 glycosyl transferase family protein [Burkholderia multivorans CGD1]QIX16834.1 glycosyltransferase family 4 protein [Burkholderia multivorans]
MVTFGSALIYALVGALVSGGILVFLLKTRLAWRIAIDQPNSRSLHVSPVPRVGGWGVLPAACVLLAALDGELRDIAVCAAFLGVVSQWDDRKGLSARLRFCAHLLAAAVFVWGTWQASLPLWAAIPVCVGVVWSINLYNFMDGSDGMAGGMAVIGFAAYAWMGIAAGSPIGLGAAAVSGAAFGFLLLNFHPAKVFLGDAGSVPLGFIAATFGLVGWGLNLWPAWFPLMVFSPFVADATFTLARRLVRGDRFWEAHREHFYQRMVQMRGHAETAWLWYGGMLAAAALAIFATRCGVAGRVGILGGWVVALVVWGTCVERRWRAYRQIADGAIK